MNRWGYRFVALLVAGLLAAVRDHRRLVLVVRNVAGGELAVGVNKVSVRK